MSIRRAAQHHLVMTEIEVMKSCPKPAPKKRGRKKKYIPPRKQLEMEVEYYNRLIVFWRDEERCVEYHLDGGRCGNGLQWGHFHPRGQCKWLKYDLGNTFCQCGNHNLLHKNGSQTMGTWFNMVFGTEAAQALEFERQAHRNFGKHSIEDLEQMLRTYKELWENHNFVEHELPELIRHGYFGEVVRTAGERT